MKKVQKTNPLKFVEIKCAFCKGTGFDRFGVPSKISKCQVCNGRGVVQVPEPYEKCPGCLGEGVYYHHRLTCSVCGGKGSIRKLNKTKDMKRCKKESKAALDIETGLPCIELYY